MPDRFDVLATDFAKLERFTRALTDGMDRDGKRKTLRAVALEFLRRVIQRTPVDTGRARAGWSAWLDANGFPVAIGGTDPAAIEEGKRASGFTESYSGSEQFIEVVNGVRYVVFLEFGSSQQAPAGMVRITIRELAGETRDAGVEAVEDEIAAADRAAGF